MASIFNNKYFLGFCKIFVDDFYYICYNLIRVLAAFLTNTLFCFIWEGIMKELLFLVPVVGLADLHLSAVCLPSSSLP